MIFTLRPKVYPVQFTFMLGEWNVKYAKRNFPKFEPPTPQDVGACYDDHNRVLIWLEKLPLDERGFGMLCHECLHATFHAARYVGMGTHESSDEFYCYMQQWLVVSALAKTKKLTNG